MREPRLDTHLNLRTAAWVWTLLAALAATGAPAAAETQVFLIDGSVSPATLREDAILKEGRTFRTGAQSVVVLIETWEKGDVECHGWTVVGSGQTHTVRSSAGKPCWETGSADEALEKALTRGSGTSRVVFRVVAQAAMDKGDFPGTDSDAFAAGLRDRLGSRRPERPDPPAPVLGSEVYTIQQLSSGRYVDAHEHAGRDFALVTRKAQNNDTQRWILRPLGGKVYTIQQLSNGRYVDAHVTAERDYELVTRKAQSNDTQRWILRRVGRDTFTIQQKANGRYVDAHEHAGRDFALVTREAQNNDTQRWVIRPD